MNTQNASPTNFLSEVAHHYCILERPAENVVYVSCAECGEELAVPLCLLDTILSRLAESDNAQIVIWVRYHD